MNSRISLLTSTVLKRCLATNIPPAGAGVSKPSPTISTIPLKPTAPQPMQVPGLSSNCVKAATGPVGPGASSTGEYKVPEYFCYSRMSFAEAEIEMAKYRLPQPSALKK